MSRIVIAFERFYDTEHFEKWQVDKGVRVDDIRDIKTLHHSGSTSILVLYYKEGKC